MNKIKVCNMVALLRAQKGYTQVELSNLTNLSQQYISNVERGVLVPSLSKAILISEALGERLDKVFCKC